VERDAVDCLLNALFRFNKRNERSTKSYDYIVHGACIIIVYIARHRLHAINAPAWNFIIGFSDRNILIEQSLLTE